MTKNTNHYYPFGLVMAGISSKAATTPGNMKGFNGNEIQNKEFADGRGLELYDFNARTYDQQVGRFVQIDPMSDEASQEKLSPYQFAENKPVTLSDPTGKCPCLIVPLIPVIAEAAVTAAAAVATYFIAKAAADQLTPVIQNAVDKNDNQQPGSYTNTHESDKKYHGKGPQSRADQSANEKAEKYNDPLKGQDWKPAKNDQEAFKDEAQRIRDDGGVANTNNYNIRNSPGEKELKKQDAPKANAVNQVVSNVSMPLIIPLIKMFSSLF